MPAKAMTVTVRGWKQMREQNDPWCIPYVSRQDGWPNQRELR